MGAGARLQVTRLDVLCAAKGGHLEVLRWARKYGCAWDGLLLCAAAAESGSLEGLQWARKCTCPWDEHNVAHALLSSGTWRSCRGRGRTGARGTRRRVTLATAGGHAEVLRWAKKTQNPGHEHDAHWTELQPHYCNHHRQ